MDAQVILIAGPTASGKSSLALSLAERLDGEIVNADSMQVYSELEVLTARPSVADCARVPHHLYGTQAGHAPYSVQHWLAQVGPALSAIKSRQRTAILVGGTGLYFSALIDGLSPMPEVDPTIRATWRAAQQSMTGPALHAALAAKDPVMATRLDPADSQRIVRALEVFDSTGRSIDQWQGNQQAPLCALDGTPAFLLLPPRDWLHHRINRRVEVMLETGAVEEVAALLALGYEPDQPVMKAIGVAQIGAYLAGRSSLVEIRDQIAARTRQYAKRQYTWMRNQFGTAWQRAEQAADIADLL